MTDSVPAKFTFKAKHLDVEFEGRAEYVSAQIDHMKHAFFRAEPQATAPTPSRATPAVAATPAANASSPASVAPPTATVPAPEVPAAEMGLEAFYKRAKSRIGRGALQETILIFAYFLRVYRNKEEFGIDNLNACFSLVGVNPPKSLANTVGIMKRTSKLFVAASRRGQYTLSEKGTTYVKKLIGA